MCEPITAAAIMSAVATVASTAASVSAQAKAAKAQTKAINEQVAVDREENRQQASAELFDEMRATRREQARIRAAAGEAGLSLGSGSVEALLMDSAQQGEFQTDRTLANMESRHQAELAQANSMMSKIQKPTALGAGIQIGSAIADGYSTVAKAKIGKSG